MFDEEVRGLEVMFCEVGGSKFRLGCGWKVLPTVESWHSNCCPKVGCRHQVKNGFETWSNLVRFVVKHF